MKLPGSALPQAHLKPGELFVTQEPQWISTVLGSCVAVTMFHMVCSATAYSQAVNK